MLIYLLQFYVLNYLVQVLLKRTNFRNSMVGPWLGLGTFTAMAWVQPLVKELRSHKPCGTAKGKISIVQRNFVPIQRCSFPPPVRWFCHTDYTFKHYKIISIILFGLLCGSAGKKSACNVGDLCSTPGWEDPLEERAAPHSSVLAWRIPRISNFTPLWLVNTLCMVWIL